MRVAAVVGLFVLSACSVAVQKPELYGAYVATYKNGSETLTLQSDGTFRQQIRPDDGDPVTNSGTWNLGRGDSEVVLESCLFVTDGFGRIATNFASRRMGCLFPIGRRWGFGGQLRLGGDESPSPYWKVD